MHIQGNYQESSFRQLDDWEIKNGFKQYPLYATPPQRTEQEPVAWGVFEGNLHDMFYTQSEAHEMADLKGSHAEVKPLYTISPQRTWVGLTLEQYVAINSSCTTVDQAVGSTERQLKENNT
jgi:hypothetical protein